MAGPAVSRFQFRQTECWTYPRMSALENGLSDQAEFFSFLDDKSDDQPLRVYLHIPFCKQFCSFCPYYKKTYGSSGRGEKLTLFRAFATEIARYAARPQIAGRKVSTIYFGGGDPGVISIEEHQIIWDALRSNFDIDVGADITMEGTALSFLDKEKLDFFRGQGVTRASFGVQTFDETLRPQLNLEPTVQQIYEAAENIKKAGFRDLSNDMMYNLPGQSEESFYRDLELIQTIGGSYVDFYALNLYPNTTYLRKIKKGVYGKQPTNEAEVWMWREIMRAMKEAGYNQVSSVSFSPSATKPHLGFDQTLKGYPMLGIGPSSRSYVAGRNFRNYPSVERYVESLDAGRFPVETVSPFSKEELENTPFVFFPIRLHLDWSAAENSPRNRRILEELIDEGFVVRRGDQALLTDEGKVWAGNVQRAFFSDSERDREKGALFASLKSRVNPYNQDLMGVASGPSRRTAARDLWTTDGPR